MWNGEREMYGGGRGGFWNCGVGKPLIASERLHFPLAFILLHYSRTTAGICTFERRDTSIFQNNSLEGSQPTEAPNQQRTLNELLTEIRCKNFVDKHQPSIHIGTKRAKTCMQCVYIPTELPFCMPPLAVGLLKKFQLCSESETGSKTYAKFS